MLMPTENQNIEAELIFNQTQNPRESDGFRSPWMSHYIIPEGKFIVFPEKSLSDLITNRGLSGEVLSVVLERRENISKGTIFFIAHLNPQQPLVVSIGETRPKRLFLFDGPNFFGILSFLKKRGKTLPPLEKIIEKILSRHPIARAKFYFCRQTAFKRDDINQSELEKLSQQLELIDRPPKIIKAKEKPRPTIKTDIDHLLIGEMIGSLNAQPTPEGLVLISGDSDYEDGVKRWLGLPPYQDNPSRPVEIISGRENSSLSSNLAEIGKNNPRANLIWLENILEEIIKPPFENSKQLKGPPRKYSSSLTF